MSELTVDNITQTHTLNEPSVSVSSVLDINSIHQDHTIKKINFYIAEGKIQINIEARQAEVDIYAE